MKNFFLLLFGIVVVSAASSCVQAQVVPYKVNGVFVGNLLTLEATGEGNGAHLGKMSFDVVADPGTGMVFDIQTAADGSQLVLVRVDLEFEITPAEDGLFNITGTDYWQIVGGTGRFANVASAGDPIVSTFYTPSPVDLSDPTAIPAVFSKQGKIDLGGK